MERLLIKAGTIIKGQDLTEVKNGAVLVEDGKISKIYEQVTDVEGLEDAVTMDVGDKTLIPGMIDCHNHLALDARIPNHLVKMSDCEAEQTLRAVKTMHDDLQSLRPDALETNITLMLPAARPRGKEGWRGQGW